MFTYDIAAPHSNDGAKISALNIRASSTVTVDQATHRDRIPAATNKVSFQSFDGTDRKRTHVGGRCHS